MSASPATHLSGDARARWQFLGVRATHEDGIPATDDDSVGFLEPWGDWSLAWGPRP